MKLYSNVYDYAIYTLNNYEDKYFINLFAHFRHKAKIYNRCAYTQIIKKNLMIKVLKYIFWGSKFDVHLCFEMYFLREQFWCGPIFWNVYFEGAILKSTYVLKCIFWGRSYQHLQQNHIHLLIINISFYHWLCGSS